MLHFDAILVGYCKETELKQAFHVYVLYAWGEVSKRKFYFSILVAILSENLVIISNFTSSVIFPLLLFH